MEILASCWRTCAPTCCCENWCDEFLQTTPLCGGRCTIYWRDNVMLFGLVVDIIGFIWAMVTGSTFFIFFTLIIAGILMFAMYYVSRYAELREMDVQLASLNREVRAQALNNVTLNGYLVDFHSQNKQLGLTADQLTHTAEQAREQLENLRNSNVQLALAERQLQQVSQELVERATALRMVDHDLAKNREDLRQVIEELATERKCISQEVRHLRNVSRTLGQQTGTPRPSQQETASKTARKAAHMRTFSYTPDPTPTHRRHNGITVQ